jgi:hypothetical protein
MDIERYRELKSRAKDIFALIDNQKLRINVIYLKSATIIQYTIKGRFMNR